VEACQGSGYGGNDYSEIFGSKGNAS